MATPLYCPNCGENLGKDRECLKLAYCDTCGQDNIKNPYGYSEDDDEDCE
jgi:ribosomal protein L37AE/L43A